MGCRGMEKECRGSDPIKEKILLHPLFSIYSDLIYSYSYASRYAYEEKPSTK